jgi:ribosomal protein S18 acetylase RimI-like enzyme
MSRQNLTIQRATEADLEELQSISIRTFCQAFEKFNTTEDMELYLTKCLSIEQLYTEMNAPGSEFYVGRTGDETVAYLKLNHHNSKHDAQDRTGLEIERIYVEETYLGKGIGPAMFSFVLKVAKERLSTHLWLGVWEHNARAIRFYEKLEFTPFGTHVFKLGNDAQTDVLMRKELKS